MLVYQRWMCEKDQVSPANDWNGINSSQLIGAMARLRVWVHIVGCILKQAAAAQAA